MKERGIKMIKYFMIRLFREKTFYLALLVGISLSLAYVVVDVLPYTDLRFMHNPYNSWIGTFTASVFAALFYMLLPIYAVIATSGMYLSDKQSGYLNTIFVRGKKKTYFKDLYIVNFITAGMCYMIPAAINVYCCFLLLPDQKIDVIINQTHTVSLYGHDTLFPLLYYSHPFLHVCMYIGLGFLVSGIFASIALAMSFYLKKVFFVWISAFVMNFLYQTLLIILIPETPVRFWPLNIIQQVGSSANIFSTVVVIASGFLISLAGYLWGVKRYAIL
jgi:hypothetical protein